MAPTTWKKRACPRYDWAMTSKPPNLLVVLGPTASGKTRLGVALAHVLGGEIISADSRQVYRGLNIGSGKDLAEYKVAGGSIPYHLIDTVDLDHEFSVFEYQARFFKAFLDVEARNALPILVGGTGLYIDSVLRGYRMVEVPENPALRQELGALDDDALADQLRALKPNLHNTTDLVDRERLVRAVEIARFSAEQVPEPTPEVRPVILGTRWPRSVLRERIRRRLRDRLDTGLIEEVEGLLASGVSRSKLEFLGLEYRYVARYIDGAIGNRDELFQGLATAIGQFAKRQESWFRRMERQGTRIHWIDKADPEAAMRVVAEASPRSGRTGPAQ